MEVDYLNDPGPETDYIVAVIDEGAYAPAETPRVFRSWKAADRVAKNMAAKHGQPFAIFQQIGVVAPR
jgi:hypothetical protein